jgi:glycosyltransferase involved in cell wall biosynthesis
VRVCMLVTTTYTDDSRVRRAAEALAEAGHDVHVLCARAGDRPRVEVTVGPVTLHRVVLRPRDLPAELTARIRRRQARADDRAPEPAQRDRRRLQPGATTTTWFRAVASPLLLIYRVLMTRRLVLAGRAIRADVVHAHDPDTLPAAAAIARGRALLLYDAHELTSGRTDVFLWERWLDVRHERRWIPEAACVVVVSQGIADIIRERHEVEPLVIRNVPRPLADPAPYYQLRERADVPAEALLVLHQGQRAPDRGLTALVRAMSQLPTAHLVLLGSAVRGMDATLHRAAAAAGVRERLHFLPPVPSDRLLSVTAQADVGVTLLEDVSLNHRLALPNKLFEYLLAGLPVVASDLPEIRRVLKECEGGVVCDPRDPASIAYAIGSASRRPDPARIPAADAELSRLVGWYESIS